VAGRYDFIEPGNLGESSYWSYQNHIKTAESILGAPIGVHGACYFFRSSCFIPLPAETINDDFVLPMRIVALGYRAVYKQDILAIELEKVSMAFDFKRRCRIAEGNVQQVIALKQLLLPKYGWLAFSFFSGKVLRLLMPICLLILLLGSGVMSIYFWPFSVLFFAQVFVYTVAIIRRILPDRKLLRWVDLIEYFVFGHVATLKGLLQYSMGRMTKPRPRVMDC